MSMLLEDIRRDIVELHAFFVGWFNGTVAQEELTPRFLSRLDPDFVFISPEGRVMGVEDLAAAFQTGFGTNTAFKIQIRDVALRREIGNTVLVTYTEWQIGAKASAQANNARVTTALMEKGSPFRWLHMQETWLPEEVRAASPFDF